MRLSSILTTSLVLAAQTTLISAALRANQILDRLQVATSSANDAVEDANAITVANAPVMYKDIVDDSDSLGDALVEDNADTQGSAELDEAGSDTIAEEFNDFKNALIKYYNTQARKASDFIVPSERQAIVAAGTNLKNGARDFLTEISELTPNPAVSGAELGDIDDVLDAYNEFATAFR